MLRFHWTCFTLGCDVYGMFLVSGFLNVDLWPFGGCQCWLYDLTVSTLGYWHWLAMRVIMAFLWFMVVLSVLPSAFMFCSWFSRCLQLSHG